MRWNPDNTLTVEQPVESQNPQTGDQDVDVLGSITADGEWWLNTAVGIIAMLPGKINYDVPGFLLCPADADPDMIGALVAAKLRNFRPEAAVGRDPSE